MAGTVDLFQRCLTGIEVQGGMLLVNPLLPEGLNEVRLRIHFRGHDLQIVADGDSVEIASQPTAAAPVTVGYRGHYRDLVPGASTRFQLIKRKARQSAQCDKNRRQLEEAEASIHDGS